MSYFLKRFKLKKKKRLRLLLIAWEERLLGMLTYPNANLALVEKMLTLEKLLEHILVITKLSANIYTWPNESINM